MDEIADFMEYLDEQVADQDSEEHELTVVFHNLRGYDGMFVLQHFYAERRNVENQICNRNKVLWLEVGKIQFKYSWCFPSYPLVSFPSTFVPTELKKYFFAHLFYTLRNQEYVGPMPPHDPYHPEGMSAKKKREVDQWYDQQVADEHEFHMNDKMIEYCTSDVKLLKAGCHKFPEEFQVHREFNPMEKCVAITSACNRYWRKKHLVPGSIAIQPAQGWHGARNNQSVKALKWLKWCEH